MSKSVCPSGNVRLRKGEPNPGKTSFDWEKLGAQLSGVSVLARSNFNTVQLLNTSMCTPFALKICVVLC